MSVQTINKELKKLIRITEQWEDNEIKTIEKAVVLSKLQEIYETLLFIDDADSDQEETDIPVENFEDNKTQSAEEDVQPITAEQEKLDEQDELEEEIEEPALGELDFELTEEFTPQEQSATPQKSKINKELIQSLYGDDDSYSKKSEPKIEVIEHSVVESATESEISITEIPNTNLERSEPEHKHILADVYAMQEHHTLGDTLGISSQRTDLATKIVTANTADLRKSIGINDKFLMIRDIFNNNAAQYEQAMDRFEQFTDLNDALLYIYDNYNANPNSDGVKLLVEMLTRKLS